MPFQHLTVRVAWVHVPVRVTGRVAWVQGATTLEARVLNVIPKGYKGQY